MKKETDQEIAIRQLRKWAKIAESKAGYKVSWHNPLLPNLLSADERYSCRKAREMAGLDE